MPVATPRIADRIAEDFGSSAPSLLSRLERVDVGHGVDPERIHAAVVLASRGNLVMFQDAIEHAQEDWRDLLDRTGLADEAWRETVLDEFGPME